MKAKILAAITLTIAACGLANAADLPPPPIYKSEPPPPAAYNWTGCYVGGGGGYGWWTQDSFVQFGGVPVTASNTNGGKGWFGQGQVGCDYQFNSPFLFNIPLLIGAFGDYEGGSIRGTSSFPGFVGTETETASWAAGARIGAIIAPRVLTYFDGGWTQAQYGSVGYNFAIAGGGPSGVSLAAQTYDGWFLGGGFEYSLDWLPISGLFLKTEYRYSQFNAGNVPLTGGVGGIPVTGATLNSAKATEMISTELVWRFNWFAR
jgi:outer membrane immunogenic protein